MREKTKVIIVVVAIAFVGLMVLEWGMDLSGRSSAELSGGEIGRVNGEPITYEQWASVYQSLYSQRQEASRSPSARRSPRDRGRGLGAARAQTG